MTDRTVTLPKEQWDILIDLLTTAGDEFGNHCCNDYPLEFNGNESIIEEFYRDGYGDDADEAIAKAKKSGKACLNDSVLMYLFKRKIKQQIKEKK